MQHLVTFYYIKDICFKFSICNLPQSPDIGRNWDRGISDFRISGQSFLKENWHNSRTRNDIDMKLGPVTKLEKRNKTMSKNLTVRSCWQMVTSLSFFQFMANMEQSRSWIQDAQSVKLTFSLTVIFYLTKTENRTKKSLSQLSYSCFG